MAFEMEFVDGLDLGQVIKSKGPLSTAHAVNYIRQAAQALQQGMLKSLVHRDIKPSNLMLTRAGNVKVADFGLAKFSWESDKGRDRSLTGMNTMIGTPDYMAPEQARNAKSADIRADIYSLGCTLYYLLTGRPPFTGKSIADLILRHWEDSRPDVCLFRSDVPGGLSQYIQRMMAQEPADRPQSPKEVVDWLTKFAKGELAKKEAEEKPKENTVAAVNKETVADVQKFTPTTKKTATNRKRLQSRKKWPMIAGAITCLLGGLAILSAAGVFQAKPKDGRIVPENRPAGTGELPEISTAGTGVLPKISPVAPSLRDPGTLVGKTRTAGEVVEVEIANDVKLTFCWIPPGEAQLGSSQAVRQGVLKQIRQDKEPEWLASEAEEVRGRFKTKGFWLGKYAVTQGEWKALMGENPSWFSKQGIGKDKVAGMNTNRFPVERVSWDDCQEFLRKLNVTAKVPDSMGKGKFALPHEDEWEYACLGGKGNRQAFYFGNALNGKQANCDGGSPFGTTTKGPSIGRTAEVGSYENMAKHPWGLCDMLGNVYQWCDNRVNRGGAWGQAARDCCSASRGRHGHGLGNFYIGCRVAFLPSGH
jgi:formylglycine-generating enzyme required for sulfatase activity